VNWLASLFSHSEKEVDSLVVASMMAIVAFIALSVYTAWLDAHTFSAGNYGAGAASILGAFGIAKGGRDRMTRADDPSNQPPQ
jgi:hypothetical protein